MSAKIVAHQTDTDQDSINVSCELTSGGVTFDQASFRADGVIPVTTLSLQGFRLLLDRGNVGVNCLDFQVGDVDGSDLNISAIKLGTATSSALPGD